MTKCSLNNMGRSRAICARFPSHGVEDIPYVHRVLREDRNTGKGALCEKPVVSARPRRSGPYRRTDAVCPERRPLDSVRLRPLCSSRIELTFRTHRNGGGEAPPERVRVLDFGAGTGTISAALAERGAQVYPVDPFSHRLLAEGRRHPARQRRRPPVRQCHTHSARGLKSRWP